MKNLTKQTKPVKGAEITRRWHLIDASEKVVGRLAPEIVRYLQGKNKLDYVPYLDSGDYVVVVNAKKVTLSGKKEKTKIYTNYSGYPGGLRKISYQKMMNDNPVLVIKHAVSGMLPKNKFRSDRLERLFVYNDVNHPHQEKFAKL